MTTEDDFQNALDLRPEDWHTRLVFADWLDPRASGYRAIAFLRRYPLHGPDEERDTTWWHTDPRADVTSWHNIIPEDWVALLPSGEGNKQFWPELTDTGHVRTRRECENALALAFAQLPPERRAELLSPPSLSNSQT